jgi:hypothetical protein
MRLDAVIKSWEATKGNPLMLNIVLNGIWA